jgi:polyribonucleotide 5'-hydroxyl-kinase
MHVWDGTDPTVCPCQLEEGSAEIFGAELQKGVPVNIKGQKLAVYTWTGCTVVVKGKADDMIM